MKSYRISFSMHSWRCVCGGGGEHLVMERAGAWRIEHLRAQISDICFPDAWRWALLFQHSTVPVNQYLLLKRLCLFEAGSAREVDTTWEMLYPEEPHSRHSGKNSIQEWQNEDGSRNSNRANVHSGKPWYTLNPRVHAWRRDLAALFCFILLSHRIMSPLFTS